MKPVFLVSFVLEELLRLIPAEVPQIEFSAVVERAAMMEVSVRLVKLQ